MFKGPVTAWCDRMTRQLKLQTPPKRRAATRSAIVTASRKLFARHGFDATSIDAIANEVGLTKGALYWHFASKDALFEGILDQIRADWREQVLAKIDEVDDPLKKLERLFDNYGVLLDRKPEICLFLQRAALEENATRRGRVRTVYKQTAACIAEILDEGKSTGAFRKEIDSMDTAHSILGLLTGCELQCHVNKALSFPDLVSGIKRVMLQGLK